jgi:hypothetical protein
MWIGDSGDPAQQTFRDSDPRRNRREFAIDADSGICHRHGRQLFRDRAVGGGIHTHRDGTGLFSTK